VEASITRPHVTQICFIGVINPQDPRVKTPQVVRDDLTLTFKYIQKERLGGTDDCGFFAV